MTKQFSRALPGAAILAAVLALGSTPGVAVGGYQTFINTGDPGVGPGASHPVYDATKAAFEASSGSDVFSTVTFEGIPTGFGPGGPVKVGEGVTATFSGSFDTTPPAGYTFGITSDHLDQFIGYNVTPGGSQFLRIVPEIGSGLSESVTFAFATPVSAFGIAITGLGGQSPGSLHASFTTGGAIQDLALSGYGNVMGGIIFFGVSGLSTPTSAVTFTMTNSPDHPTQRDVIGLDDLVFTSIIPEPPSLILFGAGASIAFSASALARRRTGNPEGRVSKTDG
jgi:hypothetical protein